jgi:hypothetical protein
VDKNGEEKKIRVPVGVNMLQAAHDNDIELEGEPFCPSSSVYHLFNLPDLFFLSPLYWAGKISNTSLVQGFTRTRESNIEVTAGTSVPSRKS